MMSAVWLLPSYTEDTGRKLRKRSEFVRTKIDEKAIRRRLYSPEMPDPDLVVRTSGEFRISNFLLWELAYAELMFVDVMWPDFRRNHLYQCLEQFAGRERRFGLTGAQVAGSDSDVEAGDA